MLLQRIRNSIRRNGLRVVLRDFDDKYGIGKLEYFLSVNWFNPIATLWLNFRSLPLSQAVRFPIWVYGCPRFYSLSGEIRINGDIKTGMISFNQSRSGSPCLQSIKSELHNRGKIIFDGEGVIGTGNRIFVQQGATLHIGRNFKIADMVNIGCMRCISIGNMSRVAHRSQIMDSNYHFVANFNKRIIPDKSHPIVIGKGCWIGNSTTVTGGAHIPNYSIIGSNSLVNKSINSIPESSIAGGIPAKLIATGFRRVNNKEIEMLVNKYLNSGANNYYDMDNSITPNICSQL